MKIVICRDSVNENDDINIVTQMLSKGIYNDYLLDNFFIKLIISEDKSLAIRTLYRKLWLTLYLKNQQMYAEFVNNDKGDMSRIDISLSEAISFIRAATPPALKHLIPDSLTSIDSILDVLEQFLVDDNSGQLITYQSILTSSIIKFDKFETFLPDSDKKVLPIFDMYANTYKIGYINIASASIDEIFNDKYHNRLKMQCLLRFIDVTTLSEFVANITSLINVYNVKIINVYSNTESKNEYPIYVSLYFDNVAYLPTKFKKLLSKLYK